MSEELRSAAMAALLPQRVGSETAMLVGIDFSPAAAAALDEATRLAAALGGRLDLMHVNENGVDWASDPASIAWTAGAGFSVFDVVTRPGLPWIELARRAREMSADLIVIGSHGRAGFHPLALGSTAARLALAAPCPVLVVNPQARHRAANA